MLVSLFRQGGARGASLAQIFKLNVVLKSMHKNMLLPTHIQKRLKEETVESGQISINSIDQVEASTDEQVDRIVKMLVAVEKHHQEGGEDN